MKNLAAFIVTKDRACQLECLLNSLEQNSGNLVDELFIIYKSSSEKFQQGYDALIQKRSEFYDKISWYDENSEGSFHDLFITVLEEINVDFRCTLGLTDDTIFYRKLEDKQNDILYHLIFSDTLCCSLRLGKNTSIQDCETGKKMLPIPELVQIVKTEDLPGNQFKIVPFGYIWDWTAQPIDDNTGYGISLDGHIYKTQDLLDLSKQIAFKNLREWEGELIAQRHTFKKHKMYCFNNSYCVNVPLNFVQSPNWPTVGPYGMSAIKLNNYFLNGEKFDIEKMFENVEVKGSHQYVKPIFYHMN